jgi:hypothetical protein
VFTDPCDPLPGSVAGALAERVLRPQVGN